MKERGDIVVLGLIERIKKARNNCGDFFSFVMREEDSGSPIRCAPHQRVLMDFVEAHPFSMCRLPPGFSKSFCSTALTLRQLGQDPSGRCAVISAAEEQAAKTVTLVRDMVENRDDLFRSLGLVFPDLLPGSPGRDPWTTTRITIKRPPGIRDPSLKAAGRDSQGTLGSRLTWVIVDDLLNDENTSTPEACSKMNRWFYTVVLSRAAIKGTRVVVLNTPWAKYTRSKDLTFELEEDRKWPSLTMTYDGTVYVRNTDWDSDDIRPSRTNSDMAAHRLTAHDSATYGAPLCVKRSGRMELVPDGEPAPPDAKPFDVDETIGLWPEAYPPERIEEIRRTTSPIAFSRNYGMRIRADGDGAPVELAWVERCKALARALGIHSLGTGYGGRGRVVTGVDLAFGETKSSNRSAIFTMVVFPRLRLEQAITLPDGRVITELRKGTRRILHADSGQWNSPELVRRVHAVHQAFGGSVAVETNGAQKAMREWMQEERIDIPIYSHHTGANKRDRNYGVEAIFYMFRNDAWLVPNDSNGVVPEKVADWIDACVSYKRDEHTADEIMACWVACELARRLDLNADDRPTDETFFGLVPSFAASIGAR